MEPTLIKPTFSQLNKTSLGTAESGNASHVRDRAGRADDRAVRRVIEYLNVLGLTDAERAQDFARACAQLTRTQDAGVHAHRAMVEAHRRTAAWMESAFSDLGNKPHPLWLRMVLSERPELFLLEGPQAKAIIAEYGDPLLGQVPPKRHLRKQRLSAPTIPRWLVGLFPTLLLSALAVWALARTLQGPLGILPAVWLALYGFLFGMTALGAVTALRGFIGWSFDKTSPCRVSRPSPRAHRVAVAVPVYQEEAAQVFANIAAMRQSLSAAGGASGFDFFVLSDSQDPFCAADEERAFRRITARAANEPPVYYRRRANNDRQKVGNVEEFFERWGASYDYVFILDADSLMDGLTMVEMVRRMEENPKWGMLQAPISVIGGDTLLCRALQWSTSVVGPLFTRGLAAWSGPHGNYYGHNAIIRTEAFLESCSLPTLMGGPPFGGPIMSHDFVEAALLCRNGWQVRTATDLAGSYEGSPATFSDYVARDRRWCQGNLQHLRIVGAPGLRMMSRLHLLIGAASYLVAPLWFAFVLLGIAMVRSGTWNAGAATLSLVLVAGLLLLPRLLGVIHTMVQPASRSAHGGAWRLLLTLPVEILFSSALAPLLLFHHSLIIFKLLVGGFVSWSPQKRNGRQGLFSTLRAELIPSVVGLSLLALTVLGAPDLMPWLFPVLVPLALATLVSLVASSRWTGVSLRRLGLFIVPTEKRPDSLIVRSIEYRSLTESDGSGRLRDLILDPVLLEAHIARLTAESGSRKKGWSTRLKDDGAAITKVVNTPDPTGQVLPADMELCVRALRLGPSGLERTDRDRLASDPDSLRWLHREAWCHWPVEDWRMSRKRPQLPEPVRSSSIYAETG